jgi:hypothetical protein
MRRFPVARSSRIQGIEWLGDEFPYPGKVDGKQVKGDTFPMTWAADGEMYASCGDPCWGPSVWGIDIEKLEGMPPDYTISQINAMPDYTGWGGWGPKPTGMISVNGVLYLAVQNLRGMKPPAYGAKSQHGSDAGIIVSSDYGRTWLPEMKSAFFTIVMFPGARFGGPAFINFGKDNEGARDEFVYAVSSDQWDNGSHLVLGRAPHDKTLDAGAWRWVSHLDDAADPTWTDDLGAAAPILSDYRWISAPEMVYLKGIKRYLLLTWHLNADFSGKDGSHLIVYDAPEPWGPFTLAHYEPIWETVEKNPYCPRIPLKWMESDGVTGWLQFSGSWEKPANEEYYRSHVRRFRLKMR